MNTVMQPMTPMMGGMPMMGMMNGMPGMSDATFWGKFVGSRRGDTATDIFAATSLPTEFANPFRSAGCVDLTPVVGGGDILRKTRPVN